MIEGKKYNLLEEVRSNFKNEVYGKKGDEVTLLSVYDHVAIVKDLKGIRFSVKISKLSIQEVEKEDNTVDHSNSKPVKRSKKAATNKQPNLF
jgi:hypothetical protein